MRITKEKCFYAVKKRINKFVDWRWCKLCDERNKCEKYNNRKNINRNSKEGSLV